MIFNDEIFDIIYPICREVESNVVGQKDASACDWWGVKNALRHSVTIEYLRRFATEVDGPLRIFNLSGLSCGHQDFSIAHYFKRKQVPIEYFALEHPGSPYRDNMLFTRLVEKYSVSVYYANLADVDVEEIHQWCGLPHVVLFTEIAEHLPHDLFLRCLKLIEQLLNNEAYVFISTPNGDRFRNRVNSLLGRENDYWGDGQGNLEKGLFGHIVYYNVSRLRRLLADAGLSLIEARTFDFPMRTSKDFSYSDWRGKRHRNLRNSIIYWGERLWRFPKVSHTVKTVGEQIILIAGKGEIRAVPLEL